MNSPNLRIVGTRFARLKNPLEGCFDAIPPGEYAVLMVKDEGVGISEKDFSDIFEPFFSTKKMQRSGTGLGMTVVKTTIEDHGGYLVLESSEGLGTTFEIFLPICNQDVVPDAKDMVLQDYVGHNELIMVVDDIESQRTVASQILRKLGYRVVSFSSGEAAVEFCLNNMPDLVLLDMVMPAGMDGLDTLRCLREMYSELKVIIVSGFAETERMQETHAMGTSGYVKKPYTLREIGTAVRSALIH